MRFNFESLFLLSSFLLPFTAAQLSGSVGPTTSYADKRKKVCAVTAYGAKADGKTDIGPALSAAWNDCKSGGAIYIGSGTWAMNTWVTLTGGTGVVIRLDGVINRTGTDGGNMIMIEHSSDIEFMSGTGRGAIQGNGYIFHQQGSLSGPRLLRFYEVQDFSVHDIALVDSPAFHFTMDTCSNGEVYNVAIRGGNSGGLDGVDVWSTNIWIHDVMVTNKDECVTVKSPAQNILIENIYCNLSGGCAFGSLGADVDISDIIYRNVYTWGSNQMLMIKSNGGSGTMKDVVLENFIGHGNAYSLNVDQYWASMSPVAGDGVQLDNITFSNWTGTCSNGIQRGPMQFKCADGAPCTNMQVVDFAMWTETGTSEYEICRSAHGTGGCLESGSGEYDAVTSTITATPSGYAAPTMAADLSTDFGTTMSIPIPAIPTMYFPGVQAISAKNGPGGCVSCSTAAAKI
ncbi:pectin lyase-like protein [Rhizodiscina lignyota]|uniref:Pectin lyase-like protein n=1 Tax=Rhizodiscina lignyota TaxID=1504668 RepID=A0A9P4I787_9PEZI|nr:pectin lyase-like protein [Rhizodiscina lignyota]